MPKDKQSSSNAKFLKTIRRAQGLEISKLQVPKNRPLLDESTRLATQSVFEGYTKKCKPLRKYHIIKGVQYEVISTQSITGEYQLYIIHPEAIGEGNDGAVYKAQNINQRQCCAVKVSKLTQTPQQHAVKHEQQALRQLDLLLGVSSIKLEDGNRRDYTFMTLIEGKPLINYLYAIDSHSGSRSKHPLLLKQVLRIAEQQLLYLQRLKREKIIHRDITPANILVSSSNLAKLIDFGSCQTSLAHAVAPVETFGYLLQDFDSTEDSIHINYTPQSDLLSLAITLSECISCHDFAGYRAQIKKTLAFQRSMTLKELRIGMPDILLDDIATITDPVKKRLVVLLRLIILNEAHLRPKLSGVIKEIKSIYQTTLQKTHSDSHLAIAIETPRTLERQMTLSSLGIAFKQRKATESDQASSQGKSAKF